MNGNTSAANALDRITRITMLLCPVKSCFWFGQEVGDLFG
jgi:hypothetical protein